MSSPYSEFDGRPELVQKKARLEWWRRIGIIVMTFYVVGSLALLSVNAVVSFATRGTLIDCTDPSGNCYKQGQARTGQAVEQLVAVIFDIDYCIHEVPPRHKTRQQLQDCVNAQQQKEGQ